MVYSFEPSQKSYRTLSAIQIEGFQPENLALGERSGQATLAYSVDGDAGAYIDNQLSPKDALYSSEIIDVTTIDSYCDMKKIKEIDLLKLDIEGYELKALAGASRMLQKNKIKLIQFEFGAPSPENYNMREFFNLLNDKYQICRILKHGYYPLKEYRHYYEINTVSNFIAIRRDLLGLVS